MIVYDEFYFTRVLLKILKILLHVFFKLLVDCFPSYLLIKIGAKFSLAKVVNELDEFSIKFDFRVDSQTANLLTVVVVLYLVSLFKLFNYSDELIFLCISPNALFLVSSQNFFDLPDIMPQNLIFVSGLKIFDEAKNESINLFSP